MPAARVEGKGREEFFGVQIFSVCRVTLPGARLLTPGYTQNGVYCPPEEGKLKVSTIVGVLVMIRRSVQEAGFCREERVFCSIEADEMRSCKKAAGPVVVHAGTDACHSRALSELPSRLTNAFELKRGVKRAVGGARPGTRPGNSRVHSKRWQASGARVRRDRRGAYWDSSEAYDGTGAGEAALEGRMLPEPSFWSRAGAPLRPRGRRLGSPGRADEAGGHWAPYACGERSRPASGRAIEK
ncbi:hypothetical protein C8Q77DRAFT_72885 [Trametes polyzona]|nr:hypothetical protein C8Q77DRAFT_72885 [Trametes polyzona]